MRGEPDLEGAARGAEELIREADDVLARASSRAGVHPCPQRLRLARDELTTKILKARATAAAERSVQHELEEARARLLDELGAARRGGGLDG